MEMILILGFGALLIFFMMNSRKKQRQQQEKLSSGLVVGARVMTTFGVFGTVVDVLPEENKVTIEAGPGTVLTVHRQAIGQIDEPVDAGLHDAGADTDSDRVDADLGDTQIPDDLSSLTPTDAHDDEHGTAGAPIDGDADVDERADADDSRADAADGSSRETSDPDADDAEDVDDVDSDGDRR
ncbi:preprotein translocase subunit YajC [Brevibacterium jeotgali]|uniref:Preprotein translocase subunit YajC n=1 Tax=Brevibacterium jeotgali TaxID=1262550 RepID=A0A2H1L2I0_9MICO|nr:preprotein translocase subunit YajC [Brevibacterium jeotgali]TWC02977.1 preprotein translocase subunit YajC [Brevibacterium jeotgali]SMY11000.1 preprotein translocase subunit YajC [Brevibacterium jeotgali]